MLLPEEDVFGEALLGALAGQPDPLELFFTMGAQRSTGRLMPCDLLTEPEALPLRDRALLERWVRGRVLDVGMGAANHLLWLQRNGFAAVGIDQGPLIVEAAKRRGASDVYALSWEDLVPTRFGLFDTVILLGNVVGAPGDLAGVRRMLRNFAHLLRPDGRLICTSDDTSVPRRGGWVRRRAANLAQHRYPGAFLCQLVYRGHAAVPVPWLSLDYADLCRIAEECGWTVVDVVWERDVTGVPPVDERAAHWYALLLAHDCARSRAPHRCQQGQVDP